jgi:hypothetical protein
MTEYKQLTSGGSSACVVAPLLVSLMSPSSHFPTFLQVPLTACSRPVRGQTFHGLFFAICVHDLPFDSLSHLGPISESDFFTWEALICGPKDTPFVRALFPFSFVFVDLSTPPYLRKAACFPLN